MPDVLLNNRVNRLTYIYKDNSNVGNPKRYTSADVVQMHAEERRVRSSDCVDDSKGVSETDDYVKTLLHHQTKTDITLKQQFFQHRDFVESSSHAPTVNKLVGLHSSEDHVKFDDLDSSIEYLKSCGLTKEEIAFKLQQEAVKKNDSISSHGYGADPISNNLISKEIERKLKAKEEELNKPDSFKGGLELSRQALVLEKAVRERQGKEEALPDCIFRQKKVEIGHPDDPINHIPDILSDIEPKPVREPRRERRRKRKLEQKLLRQQKYLDVESHPDLRKEFFESVGLVSDCHESDEVKKLKTDSLQTDDNDMHSSRLIPNNGKNLDCEVKVKEDDMNNVKKKKNLPKAAATFTLKDFPENLHFVTDGEIEAQKLTLQEIVSIERFQHYVKGHPNKTVFVKNLPNDVTEKDLVFLFGRFQHYDSSMVLFRLLNGRMKGQAFVTFPDADTAGEAISLLNGYKLRGKPVILSFGKKQDDEIPCKSNK